eukprot:1091920-Pelagomonas_calceolata.AAC.1
METCCANNLNLNSPKGVRGLGLGSWLAYTLMRTQNQQIEDKSSPLLVASQEGHRSIVRVLLDAGAAINQANI